MEPLRYRYCAYHRGVTAPGILCRIFHHFCSHWIQRHVAAQFQQIALSLNQNSLESSLENMTDASVANIASGTGRSEDDAREILANMQPIGRLVTVEEVAQAVMLCVDNGAVNGQGLNVDGGAVQS